jgi:carbon storage regulator
MLVLSRQREETIVIGREIRITVVAIRGERVKLGIDAPRAMTIHREDGPGEPKRPGKEAQPQK